MKVNVTPETVLHISMVITKEEAEYLRSLIQNVHGADPADEPPHLQEFRRSLFDSLNQKVSYETQHPY